MDHRVITVHPLQTMNVAMQIEYLDLELCKLQSPNEIFEGWNQLLHHNLLSLSFHNKSRLRFIFLHITHKRTWFIIDLFIYGTFYKQLTKFKKKHLCRPDAVKRSTKTFLWDCFSLHSLCNLGLSFFFPISETQSCTDYRSVCSSIT